jgi:uncharacterized repeat protein (TIGR03803 family)
MRTSDSRNAAFVLILVCATMMTTSRAQTFTKLADFNGKGWRPTHSLVQGTDGSLYGTTNESTSLGGTLFKLKPAGGAVAILHAFCMTTGCPDGSGPAGALTETPNGLYYGASSGGGASRTGTVFSITSNGTLTTIYTFGSQTNDGVNPYSGVVLARDGSLYGTTYNGGTIGHGTVYNVTLNGVKSTIYNFCQLASCKDGAAPYGPLIQGSDGNFYGTTRAGGGPNKGTVFKITPGGVLTTLYSFCHITNCTDGKEPDGGVAQANDGNFYGTTPVGGTYNQGTIFKITPTGTLTTLHSFCNCGDGSEPNGPLIQATDGNLYGTTFQGGNNPGTIFNITLAGTLTTLHTFNTTDGVQPNAGLLQDTDGNLYGTTTIGGSSTDCSGGCGTLFRLSVGLSPFVQPLPPFGKVGTSVFILGNSLKGTTRVSFNGTAAKFTVMSPTDIKATVPSGATTGMIQVVTPSGTLSSNVAFQVLP